MINSDISTRLDSMERNLALNDQKLSNISESFNKSKQEWLSGRKVEQIQSNRKNGFMWFNILAICFIFACTVISYVFYPAIAPISLTVAGIGCSFFIFLIFRDIFNKNGP